MAECWKLTDNAYRATLHGGATDPTSRAVSARYDRGRGRVMVRLDKGLDLRFAPRDAQELEHATAKDLAQIEGAGAGSGLHFPTLDADLSIAGLLEGRRRSDAGWLRIKTARSA